jgi:hypothetical protein
VWIAWQLSVGVAVEPDDDEIVGVAFGKRGRDRSCSAEGEDSARIDVTDEAKCLLVLARHLVLPTMPSTPWTCST